MTHVKTYLAQLQKAHALGDATEHTHRAALQQLIESTLPALQATNEPRAQQRENKPDYVVRQAGAMIGFIEAKDIGIDLKATLKTAQLKRYIEALPNLILTNYLDFVWLVRGEVRLQLTLGQVQGKVIASAPEPEAPWQALLSGFASEVTPTIDSPKLLAQTLGGQTRLLRDLVAELLSDQTGASDGELVDQLHTFQTLLIPDLSADEFADMYAQTAAYGLFTARVFEHSTMFGAAVQNTPKGFEGSDFSLEKSQYLIPKANPFLRQFFQHIASPNLNVQLRWLIEQIANGLRYVDMDKVLHRQSRKLGFEDPVFHFYESFLAEYDRALRESRGVYYTPEPVVDFIVRGVDELLKTQLGKPEGLADPGTLILDPATGTATFLRKVIEHIHASVTAGGNTGKWASYVGERLLPRIFGFELMMAPYTVAHLKLALQLQETGFVFGSNPDGSDQRLNVFLTNTLDTLQQQTDAFMSRWIAAENQGADAVKRQQPVQVVLGNPPYSGESRNKGTHIMALLGEYKREPEGGPLQERNSKWINDDYVKFIRFAHDRIARTGHGVVAFITNHGWLDNPTFRGMRASLMRDFDQIYVLDLHGNSKKKERTPEALQAQGDDKNVFDIEQGVSVVFLLKRQGASDAVPTDLLGDAPPQPVKAKSKKAGAMAQTTCAPRKAQVFHHELWGSRQHKYDWLASHGLSSAPWQTLAPTVPALLFVPRNVDALLEYERGWKVTDIFPVNSVGIVTARDALTIHFTPEAVRHTVQRFAKLPVEEARAEFELGVDVRDWSVAGAQQDLNKTGLNDTHIVPITYRPFDVRYTYYTGKSKGFHCMPRGEVMGHMVTGGNLALSTTRSTETGSFTHAYLVEHLTTHHTVSLKEVNYAFPLWLQHSQGQPHPNIAPQFLEQLAQSLALPSEAERHHLPQGVSAEDVLAYLYAVLHAPSYRSRYAEFLKSDFPRIPIQTCKQTGDTSPHTFAQVWQTLLPLGRELIALHLLRQVPKTLQPGYPQAGDNAVEKPRFDAAQQRVYINASQYFDGVSEATWQFKVGGYQVCEKWLKDRKGRSLTLTDIEHYQQTVAALARTQQLMQAIDAATAGTLWPSMGE